MLKESEEPTGRDKLKEELYEVFRYCNRHKMKKSIMIDRMADVVEANIESMLGEKSAMIEVTEDAIASEVERETKKRVTALLRESFVSGYSQGFERGQEDSSFWEKSELEFAFKKFVNEQK